MRSTGIVLLDTDEMDRKKRNKLKKFSASGLKTYIALKNHERVKKGNEA